MFDSLSKSDFVTTIRVQLSRQDHRHTTRPGCNEATPFTLISLSEYQWDNYERKENESNYKAGRSSLNLIYTEDDGRKCRLSSKPWTMESKWTLESINLKPFRTFPGNED